MMILDQNKSKCGWRLGVSIAFTVGVGVGVVIIDIDIDINIIVVVIVIAIVAVDCRCRLEMYAARFMGLLNHLHTSILQIDSILDT
jgi:hypothetical protein